MIDVPEVFGDFSLSLVTAVRRHLILLVAGQVLRRSPEVGMSFTHCPRCQVSEAQVVTVLLSRARWGTKVASSLLLLVIIGSNQAAAHRRVVA